MVRSRGPRNQRLAAEVYREALRPCFLTVRTYGYRTPFMNADRNDASSLYCSTSGYDLAADCTPSV